MKNLIILFFSITLSISCQKEQNLEMDGQTIVPAGAAALLTTDGAELQKAEANLGTTGIIFTDSIRADNPSACSIDNDHYYSYSNSTAFDNDKIISNLNLYISLGIGHLERSKALAISEDGTISRPNVQSLKLLERKVNCAKFILGQRASSKKE